MSRAAFLAERSAQKRRLILRAARAVFAREGYQGAGTERIAAEAGVSTATLYRLFPSKLALFEAVLREGTAAFEASLADPGGASGDGSTAGERLTRLAAHYARTLDDPDTAALLRAVIAAAPAAPEVVGVFYEAVKRVVAERFHRAVLDAAREGRLAPPGGETAGAVAVVMGAIEHATLWRRLLSGAEGAEAPDAIAETAVAAMRRAFAPADGGAALDGGGRRPD